MCSISVGLSDKSRAVFLKSQFSESTNLLDFQIGKRIHLNPNYECTITENVKYTVRFLVCFCRICSSEQQIKPFTKSAKVLDHPWQGKQKTPDCTKWLSPHSPRHSPGPSPIIPPRPGPGWHLETSDKLAGQMKRVNTNNTGGEDL